MVDTSLSKYAILNRKTKLLLFNKDLPSELTTSGGDADHLCLEPGTTVQIFHMKCQTPQSTNISKYSSIVKILDYANNSVIYENLYECPLSNLQHVSESLWPYVISIVEPYERLQMIQNVEHCNWILSLKLNDTVKVLGGMFNYPNTIYTCIVRYIGPVTELYPVGYFFGLELQDSKSTHLLPKEKMPFSSKYLNHPDMSIYTTANWIRPLEVEKKFSTRDFITDTFDKVVSAIGPASALVGGGGNTSSLKKEKKLLKHKENAATSQFYDTINTNTNSYDTDSKNIEVPQSISLSSEKSLNVNESKVENVKQHRSAQTQTQTRIQHQPFGILKHKRSPPPVEYNVVNIAKGYGRERDIVIISDNDISPDGEVIVLEQPQLNDKEYSILRGDQKALDSTQSTRHNLRKDCISMLRSKAKSPTFQSDTNALPTVLNDDEFSMLESSLKEIPQKRLGIGSMVEVYTSDVNLNLYGVVRWIGIPPGAKEIMVGVELEDEYNDENLLTTDGTFHNISLFKCPKGRGLFVTPSQCACDRRFIVSDDVGVDQDGDTDDDRNIASVARNISSAAAYDIDNLSYTNDQTFGHVDCPIVPGAIAPLKCLSLSELEEVCGKFKGIQGHHNSCYLDVTLFSMFTFTPVFDSILYRLPNNQDIDHYEEVQTVLRDEIVNPLRKHMFVRADRVMKLRHLLDKLSSIGGLTTEEKDPEEFLNCLLSQIMKAEPFLKLSSGQDAYYYQLFVEKDEHLVFPSVQQLFEQSFYASDIKLKEVPSCLIIQMPRFGKNYKMYRRILPSQVLDITDIIENSPRQCTVCGKLAEYECRDCFGTLQSGSGLECTAFCPQCLQTVHNHDKRLNHTSRKLLIPQDFCVMVKHMSVPRLYMELFAVVCIETSHYVSFVKTGSGPDAPWCFFDSMADRKGEQNGYNIPEILTVPDVPHWLSEDGARNVHETSTNDKLLPEHAKRLFCDAYMCMYQSTDVMMYR